MVVTSKMYDKFQLVVPAKIRKELGLKNPNNIVEWEINDNQEVVLRFKKILTIEEMKGRYKSKEPYNSVETLKKIERGE